MYSISVGQPYISSGYCGIAVKDDRFDGSASAFEASLNGVKLVYELATPSIYTVTSEQLFTTLYGQNNVWTDVGEVSIDYPSDTKLYIDNKIATAVANALNA